MKTTFKERLLKKLKKKFIELDADCDWLAKKYGYHDEEYNLARGRLQNMVDVINIVNKSRD